jgi:hypothetical protein
VHHRQQEILAADQPAVKKGKPGPVIIGTRAALVSIQALSPADCALFAAFSTAARRALEVWHFLQQGKWNHRGSRRGSLPGYKRARSGGVPSALHDWIIAGPYPR